MKDLAGLFICSGILVVLVLPFVLWIFLPPFLHLLRERRKAGRGFEVKRTTGQTPVLMKERENDHG